jgi:hypothetical protein
MKQDRGPCAEGAPLGDVLEISAAVLYARWRRAVDLLWRESVIRRRLASDQRETARDARRRRNLQRIVRKALADYHRIELERQARNSSPRPPA